MVCPKCGLQVVPEQKFCRSCGASLQAITQRLPESLTLADGERRSVVNITSEQISRTNKLMLWGMIILFVGAATGVIGKMLMHDQMVALVGVLVSLAGMFVAAYSSLVPPRTKNYSSLSSTPGLQTPSQPPKSLPEERPIEYVPSITERTTDLLKSTANTPKRKDENA